MSFDRAVIWRIREDHASAIRPEKLLVTGNILGVIAANDVLAASILFTHSAMSDDLLLQYRTVILLLEPCTIQNYVEGWDIDAERKVLLNFEYFLDLKLEFRVVPGRQFRNLVQGYLECSQYDVAQVAVANHRNF